MLLIITIAGLGYAGYLTYTIKNVADKSYEELDHGKKSDLREEKVTLKSDPVTILLMGVDDYVKNDKGRTDTLLLMAFNPTSKEVAMVSIPRDTRVYLPSKDKRDKINAAYAYDNEQGAVDAVQSLIDVPVDYYIKTGVKGFKEVIDELGGITVDVPFNFKQVDLKNKYVYFKKGPMTLNGREALAFVQMRKEDPRGDFGREERQQEAIRAMADKAVSLNTLTKANRIIETLGSNIKTNIQLNELLGLRTFYEEIQNKEFNRLELEGEDKMINGIYYFVPTQQSVQEVGDELRRVLEINQNTQASTDLQDNNSDSNN
ncbi:LCP family protein [Neobacillus sp. MM2021_6]|uniref:LCP family protein n=1 Tax=Bacillaceae TaxID=186817 RepID=UPI00140BB418|nr:MULTISPECIES: LCP family protein [Bacillaceae]MBO0961499.1 LCP family protein [Neobacillus sp. MM2021_6]